MKRLLSLIVILAVLCSAITLTVSAASRSSGITPYYNNVYGADQYFSIDENGNVHIGVSYSSDPGVVTSATVEVRLLKRTLLVIWTEVESWSDSSTSSIYSNVFTTTLNKTGTYKVEITYTINGTGGEADVITKEIKQTY